MRKIAIQLKLYGESEIASNEVKLSEMQQYLSEIVWVSAHVCSSILRNVQFEECMSLFTAEVLHINRLEGTIG